MRVGIVGAGIAGLSAARELAKQKVETVLFEAAECPGGRSATENIHGCIVDTGLQAYTPRGMSLEEAMLQELPTEDLVLVARPVGLYEGGRAMHGSEQKNRLPRYTYKSGAARLPELLAEGLDVRYGESVEGLERAGKGVRIAGEEFDAVILTPPIDEVLRLLATIGDSRPLANAAYRPCLSLALGYKQPTPEADYYALLAMERITPVLWIGIEDLKAPGRSPEGESLFIVQMGPEFSRARFDSSESVVAGVATAALAKLFGKEFETPEWTHLVRWEYSQPERVVLFESANRGASNVIVAGDGTMAGRAESAFETGLMAARRVLEG